MTRTNRQTQPTGTTQQNPIWRQGVVQALTAGIQTLETELNFQRNMYTQLTGGNARAGTAGGVSARRAPARATGGTGGGGSTTGGTNRDYVTNLLRQHSEGLAPPQIRQMAIAAGRTIGASFPFDTLRTGTRNHTMTRRGNKYYLRAGVGGTGQVARSGTARTARVRSRARKPMARAMGAGA